MFQERIVITITKKIVIKKDGTRELYNESKIIDAISKSAERAMVNIDENGMKEVLKQVKNFVDESSDGEEVSVPTMHFAVENALLVNYPSVAESYRSYRNYKTDFIKIMDRVFAKEKQIRYMGDKENANTDSALVSTQRSLAYGVLAKELYKKFFLNEEELQACKDGYIYVHDMTNRMSSMNCCLFDLTTVLKGGFNMSGLWYNEPKTLDVAFDVISDVVFATASQQYGGFTVPEIDKVLEPYAVKSYNKHYNDIVELLSKTSDETGKIHKVASTEAFEKVRKEFENGWQGLEYKFNSVSSSRGDFVFTTLTTGLNNSVFGKLANETLFKVRMEGQGKQGKKKPVVFPKLVFLYDKNLHGEGKEMEDTFEQAVKCSSLANYPK